MATRVGCDVSARFPYSCVAERDLSNFTAGRVSNLHKSRYFFGEPRVENFVKRRRAVWYSGVFIPFFIFAPRQLWYLKIRRFPREFPSNVSSSLLWNQEHNAAILWIYLLRNIYYISGYQETVRASDDVGRILNFTRDECYCYRTTQGLETTEYCAECTHHFKTGIKRTQYYCLYTAAVNIA